MRKTLSILSLCAVVIALGFYFFRAPSEPLTSGVKSKKQTPRLPSSINSDLRTSSPRAMNALAFTASERGFSFMPTIEFKEVTRVNFGRDYDLSLEFRATPYTRFNESLGERVSMINGFVIYRPKDGLLDKEEARRYGDNSFPVVKSVNSSMIGLLTGRLIVKCMDPNFDVEAELGAKMIYKSDGLGVTYLKIPEGADLIDFYQSLATYDQIDRADLEILQGGVTPR